MGFFAARRNGRLGAFGYLAAVAAVSSLWLGAGSQALAADAPPNGFRYSGTFVDFVPFDSVPDEAAGGPANFKYYGSLAGFTNLEPRINVRNDLSPNLPFGAGGSLDSANAFPNVVLVEFFDPTNPFNDFICSGTLINARTVLTAAHCMAGLPGNAANYQPHVYFGNNVLSDFLAFHSLPGTSHVANAGFDPNAFYLGNDLGLVSLSQPVFATGTARAGLRSGIPYAQLTTTAPAIGTNLTLVGYGQAGTGSAPGTIFDLKRRIATNQVEYVGKLADLGFPVPVGPSNLIFTDFEDPNDPVNSDLFFTPVVTANEGTTDNGDSGGPIFATIGGLVVQVGTTSGGATFGLLQGGYSDLAFWTSVADFNAWIAANSPLQNASSVAGDANWSAAAHWSGGVAPTNFNTPFGSIADFTNPARYYNVTLSAAGTTTLSDAREIDLLNITNPTSQLNVTSTGNLFVWSDATVTNGILRVDGTIDVGKLTLTGGRLQGIGHILNAVGSVTNSGGVVAPGNSIGTLTITGNFVQGPAGLLEIELTNGASDVLAISGNASLGGTVKFLPFGPNPLEGQSYTFLTTGGTVTGRFAAVQDFLPGALFPIVSYGSNFARVTVSTFCSFASGPIQTPTCGALNDPAVQADPDMATSLANLQALASVSASDFSHTLEALNPTRVHAQSIVGLSTGDLLRNQFGRRTHDLFGGTLGTNMAQLDMTNAQLASADPTAEMLASAATAALGASDAAAAPTITLPNGNGLFFAADMAMTDTDQPAALGKDQANVAALTAGFDHSGGNFAIGAALSYLQSSVRQDYGLGGDTSSNGFAISGYSNLNSNRFYVDAFLSYAWHDFDTERALLVGPGMFAEAKGSTNANHTQAGATVGYALNTTNRASFGAVGGLYYINLDIDGYTETGAGALSAVIPNHSIESLKGQIGGELSVRLKPENDSLVPILRLVWNHEFMDDALIVRSGFAGAPATTFTTPGPNLGDDWATIGVGLSGRVSDGTSFYFRYQHDLGRDGQDNQEVSAAARMAF